MRKQIWIGLFLFLCGLLVSLLMGEMLYAGNGILNEAYLRAYGNCTEEYVSLLGRVFAARGKLFFFIWLILMTKWQNLIKRAGKYMALLGLGIFCGILCSLLGLWGILIALAAVFPHGIFYVAAVIVMSRIKVKYDSYGKRKNIKFFLQMLIFVVLFVTAVWTECSFGVPLFKFLLRVQSS